MWVATQPFERVMSTSTATMKPVVMGLCGLFLLALMGCNAIGPEDNSGSDTARPGAQTMPLETVVTDAINFEGGDATDWKSFTIESPGAHTLEFFWDNPLIQATVALHDQYGTLMQTVTHQSGGTDVLTVDLPESGLYYLRIRTQMYRTTYSVRVYEGPPRDAEDWQEDPIPELDRPI